MIRPFIPDEVDGERWQDASTAAIAADSRYFSFAPRAAWHGFAGYAKDQYLIDPCKLLLTTPGIDAASGEYADFGIPATILANYLRENGVVPEKCDLNSILFLLTPAESMEKMVHLVAKLAQFEQHIREDALLRDVLPTIYRKNAARYEGYTLRRLCLEMHQLYVGNEVKDLQKAMFRQQSLPKVAMNPQDANIEFIRGNVELVPIAEAEGRIAAEGALPYPPGVLCVVPGEVWGGAAQRYFLALEKGLNGLPGFSPELQGVYVETDENGVKRLMGYMLSR
jgi:ornithine decarboxylase